VLIVRTTRSSAADGFKIEINDDTTDANYSGYVEWHYFDSGMGDQTPVNNRTIGYANAASAPSDEFAVYDITIYDYASTNKKKEIQVRGGQRAGTGSGDHYIYDCKAAWLSNSPVTKVEYTPVTGPNFAQYCVLLTWLEG